MKVESDHGKIMTFLVFCQETLSLTLRCKNRSDRVFLDPDFTDGTDTRIALDVHYPYLIPSSSLQLITTEGSAYPDLHGTAQQPISQPTATEGRTLAYLPLIFAQCAGTAGRTSH